MKKNTGPKIKTAWDFSALYSSPRDPKIEADVAKIEAAYTHFAQAYSQESKIKEYSTNPRALEKVLNDWNDLMAITGNWKPVWYLHLLNDIDVRNTSIKALYTKYLNRLIEASNKVIFFNLALGKIEPKIQKQLLSDKGLQKYKVFLESIFEVAKFNLSEKEEKILSLKYGPSHEMWVNSQKKYLSQQMVRHGKKFIPITEAQVIKSDLPLKQRRALHVEIVNAYKRISFFAEAELNAIITNKRITDELRGLRKPYEATVRSYQNSLESVEALVSAVNKKMKDAQEFYKLKAKAMGLKELYSADISSQIGKNNTSYSLEQGVELIADAFRKVKPEFAELFLRFLERGQMDIHPKASKRGGAYCSGGIGTPTYILLNHADKIGSLFTMAHEMGHAIHFEYSKQQIPLYEDFTISIAEVASTFFENVFFDYMYERASAKDKRLMLLSKIEDNVTTIHAQIVFFNFELDLHNKIKEKGVLSAEEIAQLFMAHRKKYYGNAVKTHEYDGYAFVAVPHFRSFFYTYAYAYGQIIANALYAEYKKNPQFLSKIEQFLSAGSSMRPDDVFTSIGIDVKKPEFFEQGLKEITNRVAKAKKLF